MSDASKISVGLIRLPHGVGLELPEYASLEAAGFDLHAACPADKPIVIGPGQRCLVPSGFVFEIPSGFEGQIRPRSGLAFKHAITCLNSPGTIDSDYRGEVKVLLINHGKEQFVIERSMRIAQMIIAPVLQAQFIERPTLSKTERGQGGFGSTGQ